MALNRDTSGKPKPTGQGDDKDGVKYPLSRRVDHVVASHMPPQSAFPMGLTPSGPDFNGASD